METRVGGAYWQEAPVRPPPSAAASSAGAPHSAASPPETHTGELRGRGSRRWAGPVYLDGLGEALQGQVDPDAELEGEEVLPVRPVWDSRTNGQWTGEGGRGHGRYLSVPPAHLSSSAALLLPLFFFSLFFLLSISSWTDRQVRRRSGRVQQDAGVPHQLLLQVDGPENGVVSHGEDEEEEEGQLPVAHLPHSAVVEDRLPPVGEAVEQDVVIPAHTGRSPR